MLMSLTTVTDAPTQTEPAAFKLALKQLASVYFKAANFPAKVSKSENDSAEDDGLLKIPAAHMAGQVRCHGLGHEVAGSCLKRLQPIRSMVVSSANLTIPPGKVLQIVKPE